MICSLSSYVTDQFPQPRVPAFQDTEPFIQLTEVDVISPQLLPLSEPTLPVAVQSSSPAKSARGCSGSCHRKCKAKCHSRAEEKARAASVSESAARSA